MTLFAKSIYRVSEKVLKVDESILWKFKAFEKYLKSQALNFVGLQPRFK